VASRRPNYPPVRAAFVSQGLATELIFFRSGQRVSLISLRRGEGCTRHSF
jgi:hypothetical protein